MSTSARDDLPFDVAFLQEQGNGRLEHENAMVRDHCIEIGLPVQLFTQKRIDRRQLPLNRRSYVFGDLDAMHGAMRQLDIAIPAATYYPASLSHHLHRRVWLDTLGYVRSSLDDGGPAVFAKPASRAKKFTGRVFRHHDDFYHTGGTSWREPVWCSEIVTWRSEYRVYVNGTTVVSIDHYDGDETVALDRAVVDRAVAEFAASGEAPAAYGIDFGVLASRETALIEANDGYSLGAYGIGNAPYTELTFTRWRQLLGA